MWHRMWLDVHGIDVVSMWHRCGIDVVDVDRCGIDVASMWIDGVPNIKKEKEEDN